MGNSLSRIQDIIDCYESFCEKLNEKSRDYDEIKNHTKELREKYNITKSLWWYHEKQIS